MEEDRCPICFAKLKTVVVINEDIDECYDGVECPNGCNLFEYYGE